MTNPAKDAVAKAVNVFHRSLVHLSGGRVGGDVMGMPVVELTTTGRKSGQKRTVMLTTPVEKGDTVVLVASYGGDEKHPSWYTNLLADPDVSVRLRGGPARAMRARTASVEERAELWPQVTSRYKGYAQYQTRTDREIPLVIVEPA